MPLGFVGLWVEVGLQKPLWPRNPRRWLKDPNPGRSPWRMEQVGLSRGGGAQDVNVFLSPSLTDLEGRPLPKMMSHLSYL